MRIDQKPRQDATRKAERVRERQVFLIALAFRSPWACRHLPPDPRSPNDIIWQMQYMFMLAAENVAPHLNLEIADSNSDLHRIWREAGLVLDSGPVPLTPEECAHMRLAVLDMETRVTLHRASLRAFKRQVLEQPAMRSASAS